MEGDGIPNCFLFFLIRSGRAGAPSGTLRKKLRSHGREARSRSERAALPGALAPAYSCSAEDKAFLCPLPSHKTRPLSREGARDPLAAERCTTNFPQKREKEVAWPSPSPRRLRLYGQFCPDPRTPSRRGEAARRISPHRSPSTRSSTRNPSWLEMTPCHLRSSPATLHPCPIREQKGEQPRHASQEKKHRSLCLQRLP